MKSSFFKKIIRPIVSVLLSVLFLAMGTLSSYAALYTDGSTPSAKYLYDLSKDKVISSQSPVIYTQTLSSTSQANVIKFSIKSGVFCSAYSNPINQRASKTQKAYYCISTIDNPNDRLVIQGRASYDTKGTVYTASRSGLFTKTYSRSVVAESTNNSTNRNYQIVVALSPNEDYCISTSVDTGRTASYQLKIEPNVDKNYDCSMGGRWEATDKYVESGLGTYTNSITYLNKDQTAQLYNVLCALNDTGAISLQARQQGPWGIFQELISASSVGWAFVSTFVPVAKLASLGITAADLALSNFMSYMEQKDLFDDIDNDIINYWLKRIGSLTLNDVRSMMSEVKKAGGCNQTIGYKSQYFTAKNGISMTETCSVYYSTVCFSYAPFNGITLEGARYARGKWVSIK